MGQAIILIGPARAGKSTIGGMLSHRLGMPHVPMDTVRFDYYREVGYDEVFADHLRQTGGFWSLYGYWKPFEAHAVERVLTEHPDAVIDFGAGHSVYDDEVLFNRVAQALSAFPYVVLLLPSANPERSLAILAERDPSFAASIPTLNRYFVRHPSNHRLAKFVIYTEGKTPEETCEEVICVIEAAKAGSRS